MTSVGTFRRLTAEQSALFEHGPLPVLVLDAALRIRFINAAARALTTIPADVLYGQHLLESFPEFKGSMHVHTYQRIIDTGQPERFEVYFDGAQMWHAVFAWPADGGVVAVLEDVSERRRAEIAMQVSEESLSRAQDLAMIGSWKWNIQTGEVQWSPQTYRILGLDPTTVIPDVALVRAHARGRGDEQRWERALTEAIAGTRDFEVETSIVRPDGERVYTLQRGRVVRDANGAPHHMFGIVQDISARRLAEEQLRRSEETLRLAQEAANIGSWDHDLRNRVSHWSDQMCRIVGLDPAVVDQSQIGIDPELDFVHADDREIIRQAWKRAIAGEGIQLVRSRIIRRNGDVRHLASSTMLVRDHRGEKARLVGTALDITDQVRAEEERLTLAAQIQQAQKLESLGVLAGGIAHDFNNLLVGILGNASLALLDLSPHAAARRSVTEIEQAAQRAADLTRQLLAYAGKGRFVVEPVDVSHIVGEMAALLRTAVSKSAVVQLDLPTGLPSVEADSTQLRQVVMNLITNASDAIGESGGLISIHCGQQRIDASYLQSCVAGTDAVPGNYVFVEVRDTGGGMTESTQRRIFDPFFSTKFTGRGLGLAATLGILRGHRGAIRVYSEVGHGTSIKLLFPSSDRAASKSMAVADRDWRGDGRVLIVDDEPSVRAVAGTLLARRGFETVTADSGMEAVRVFRASPGGFRLVLLDLTMPGMGGEETFRALRDLQSDIRVVLMSGYNEQEVTRLFVGRGLADFLQKPFRAEELFATIGRTLGLEPHAGTPEGSP